MIINAMLFSMAIVGSADVFAVNEIKAYCPEQPVFNFKRGTTSNYYTVHGAHIVNSKNYPVFYRITMTHWNDAYFGLEHEFSKGITLKPNETVEVYYNFDDKMNGNLTEKGSYNYRVITRVDNDGGGNSDYKLCNLKINVT